MLKVWRLPCTFTNYNTSTLSPLTAENGSIVSYFTTCDRGVDHRNSFVNNSDPTLKVIHVTEYSRLRIEPDCSLTHIDPLGSTVTTGITTLELLPQDATVRFANTTKLDFYFPFHIAQHLPEFHVSRFINRTNKTAILHFLGPEVTVFEQNINGNINSVGSHHRHVSDWNFLTHEPMA
jgi:hypothetical protein